MMRTLGTLAAALAAVALAASLALAGPQPVTGHPVPATLPACGSEDGSTGPLPCRWSGGSNGRGLSYVLLTAPGIEDV